MFSKLAVVIAASLAVFVAAAPANNEIKNSCNTGTAYCCNETYQAGSKQGAVLSQLVNIVVPANTNLGAACSPLNVLAIGSNSCSQQPVCCSGNNYNGVVVVGCTPINVNA